MTQLKKVTKSFQTKINSVLFQFFLYYRKKGYLQGESLRTAISMACNMSNLKLSYLYSVLNLCGIDSANLKIFNIITSLALKINYLDDEWFKNLLPQLDLSSVENKVFKVNIFLKINLANSRLRVYFKNRS
jgi:hypothetical protein